MGEGAAPGLTASTVAPGAAPPLQHGGDLDDQDRDQAALQGLHRRGAAPDAFRAGDPGGAGGGRRDRPGERLGPDAEPADPQRAWPPVPRLWPGDTVVIAGAGPSLAAEDLERVQARARQDPHVRLIVINRIWQWAPWADLLYACDGKWWRSSEAPGPGRFAGLKATQDPRAAEFGALRVPLDLEGGTRKPGMSLEPWLIRSGANSGYQALNLSLHLAGAGRRILLGFDMQAAGRATHCHGEHDAAERLKNPGPANFEEWRSLFASAVPDLARAGVEVVNCSRDTALTCFPRASLEDLLP